MPPTTMQMIQGFNVVGEPAPQPGHEPEAIFVPATTGFLEALHINRISGRSIEDRDGTGSARVVVISRELARRYFAKRSPLGQRLVLGGDSVAVIGVVDDAVYEGLATPIKPTVYVPFSQQPFPGVWLAIRGNASPSTLARQLRAAITGVDPTLAVYEPQPLDSKIAESVLRPRFQTWVIGSFGGLALLLASIGIYSVIAYGVTQRRGEIGIRLALGASQPAVVRMVIGSGMRPVIVGLIGGLLAAMAGTRLLSGLLYGVAPTDALTFAGVAVVLGTAGVTAAYLPARRAARVDPLTAIRAE
jgi:predicted permease